MPARAIGLHDNGDGTVTDWDTGLTWQQQINNTEYSWSSAQTYCFSLPLSNGGWRLPNVKELASIVERSPQVPAINSVYFPDVIDTYWSASSYADNGSDVWMVEFLVAMSSLVVRRVQAMSGACAEGNEVAARCYALSGLLLNR